MQNMERTIKVPHVHSDSGDVTLLSVEYSVVEESPGIVVYHCSASLPDGGVPEWLSPSEFQIRVVRGEG